MDHFPSQRTIMLFLFDSLNLAAWPEDFQ